MNSKKNQQNPQNPVSIIICVIVVMLALVYKKASAGELSMEAIKGNIGLVIMLALFAIFKLVYKRKNK